MVGTVVAALTHRVSPALPVIVSDYLKGYLLSGAGPVATESLGFVGGLYHQLT